MDDILRRMMDVERQAAQLVEGAEAEAQRLLDAGRQKAAAEAQRLKGDLADEVRRLVEDRVAAAEKQKAEALQAAETRLQTRAHAFTAAIRAKRTQGLQELAYPLDAGGR